MAVSLNSSEAKITTMKLRSFTISKTSPFIGKTLKDSGIRDKYNCMVVGVDEGQKNLTLITPSRCL